MKKTLVYAVALTIATVFASCSKDKVEVIKDVHVNVHTNYQTSAQIGYLGNPKEVLVETFAAEMKAEGKDTTAVVGEKNGQYKYYFAPRGIEAGSDVFVLKNKVFKVAKSIRVEHDEKIHLTKNVVTDYIYDAEGALTVDGIWQQEIVYDDANGKKNITTSETANKLKDALKVTSVVVSELNETLTYLPKPKSAIENLDLYSRNTFVAVGEKDAQGNWKEGYSLYRTYKTDGTIVSASISTYTKRTFTY